MKTASDMKLLIVYNADSGFFNALSSSIHKALSPETYACQLCRITYGMTHVVGEWQAYLEGLSIPVQALHRNEFQVKYPSLASEALPALFVVHAGAVEVLLGADVINATTEITSLITQVDAAISAGVLSV